MLSRLQSATVAAFTLGAFGLGAVLAPVAVASEADSTSTAVVAQDSTSTDSSAATTDQAQQAASSATVSAAQRERNYARGLGLAKDRYGIRPSLYRGSWYSPIAEKHRICIAKRESHGNYKAGSSRSAYQGAYQMSRSLARGATWMMQPSVKKLMGDEGVRILAKLRKTPVVQWNRYWQDRAFFTIWRDGRGKSHWSGLCWKSPAQIKAEKIAHAKAVAKAKAHAKAVAKAKAKAKAKAAAKKKAWAKAHPKAAAKAKARAEAKKKAIAKKKAAAKKKSAAKKKAEAKKKSAAKKKAAAKKKQKR